MAPAYLSTEITISSGMIPTFSLRHSPIPCFTRGPTRSPLYLNVPESWYYQRILSLCSALSGARRNIFFPNPLASYPCHPDTDPLHLRRPNLVEKGFFARLAPDEGWFSLAQRSPKSYTWIKSACLFIRSFLHHVREDGKSHIFSGVGVVVADIPHMASTWKVPL